MCSHGDERALHGKIMYVIYKSRETVQMFALHGIFGSVEFSASAHGTHSCYCARCSAERAQDKIRRGENVYTLSGSAQCFRDTIVDRRAASKQGTGKR